MKRYDTGFIKKYIEEHKDQIKSVECGVREQWFWTADTIFEGGKFGDAYDWNSRYINVAGIIGVTWETLIMEVSFKDGRTEIVECWEEDGYVTLAEQIEKKASKPQLSAVWII